MTPSGPRRRGHPDAAYRLGRRQGSVGNAQAWPLDKMYALLETLKGIDTKVKEEDYLEAVYGLGI